MTAVPRNAHGKRFLYALTGILGVIAALCGVIGGLIFIGSLLPLAGRIAEIVIVFSVVLALSIAYEDGDDPL